MLELMFTLALGNYSGAFGPHDKFGQSRPWRDYEDLPFYHDFCLAAKIGCDEAVIRSCPHWAQCLLPLFGGIAGSFCLMAPRRMASSGSFYSPSVRR